MAKLDFLRDYYGDLELSPTSGSAEIKKQYKKLALLYHPDRNVGINNLDTTKFQRIQAAYEILIDPLERAKYDANRNAGPFANLSRRTKTGTKGNPWSNVGKEYPPPPKPSTARNRPAPPSNGARNYEKFTTPQQSAYQASQEGPQARKATYYAWEKMRGYGSKTESSAGNSRVAPDPPPREASHSARKDKKPVPPARPQESDNHNHGNQKNNSYNGSTPTTRKKGFMPSTPGGDELPAPRGHYFMRVKVDPPPVPSQDNQSPISQNSGLYPETSGKTDERSYFEPRMSTPYATHGGERIDPFQAPADKINRSKSTSEREPNSASIDNTIRSEKKIDPKIYASHRTSSFRARPTSTAKSTNRSSTESSDSDDTCNIFSNMNRSNEAVPVRKEVRKNLATAARKHSNRIPQTRPLSYRYQSEDSSSSSSSQLDTAPCPEKADSMQSKQSNIFSFSIKDDTFNETKFTQHDPRLGNSSKNISTKFSAEEWDGKFSAGSNSDYLKPNSSSTLKSSNYFQNGTRARARSPAKPQPSCAKRSAKTEKNSESSNRKKFTPEEWAETFKPQIFMSPPLNSTVSGSRTSTSTGRKRTSLSNFSTISASKVSAGISTNITQKKSKNIMISDTVNTNIATPEPMDIDTPLGTNANPSTPISKDIPQDNLNSQKLRDSQPKLSLEESELQATALKVNFSDLKIKDIIMDFPSPPKAPTLLQEQKSGESSYHDCEMTFQHYMTEWDQFENKFLLHLVARKNNYTFLGDQRWKGPQNEYYRNTIREDQIVLRNWAEAKETHEKAIKSWIVFKDVSKAIETNALKVP
ncbi:hypothetical protein GcM1_231021 [Golovinomyces cichoracearum]|uniref:J domain-containing protein n=1 Tax=Golovinomyces cichoracearum TaxID=62708 RepID=A0A420IMN5_9PEZI|nr:hypothetical protein GcM1_231021 [Golovinomyces cichoracearum]